MRVLKSCLSKSVKTHLQNARRFIRTVPYYGKGRYCPVCSKSSSRFRPSGAITREDAQCVHCGALERHRLLYLFWHKKSDLFDGKPKKMLHVAPEQCFESMLKDKLASDYLTADLLNPHAMVKMDICDIQYPEKSFDVICCNHVLEHVPDDMLAMRELFRILKKNGWAILKIKGVGDT